MEIMNDNMITGKEKVEVVAVTGRIEGLRQMMMRLAVFSVLLVSVLIPAGCGGRSGKRVINKQEIKTNKIIMKTIHLTKSEFLQKVVDFEKNSKEWNYLGDKPAIVDFYASWCGPCKSLSPVLEELAEKYGGKIYIYKVNTEEEMDLASAFGISSIPTLLFIPMGKEPQMARGALPKFQLEKIIEDFLLK